MLSRATESSAPVDIITAADLKVFAQKDVSQILNYAMQYFSSNRQTISGGTDHIDPISLRGLGPDQVLVLVNGKRRHSSALVNIEDTFGRGASGTDLNSIPVSSIERIEILKEGQPLNMVLMLLPGRSILSLKIIRRLICPCLSGNPHRI